MVLETRNLSKSFGNLTAVGNVSMKVSPGVTHAIIGPNGAGKSTLFNLISGVMEPSSGQILFKGEDIVGNTPHKNVRLGIAKTYQNTNIFGELSVRENIRLGSQARVTTFDVFSDARTLTEVNRATDRILEQVRLDEQRDTRVDSLPYGDQRKVEIGIVLATEPDLILLDEPTAGMSRMETSNMVELLEDLAEDESLTIIITEHDLELVLTLADRVSVLHNGAILSEGDPRDIEEDEEVQRVYIGAENAA